MEQNETVDQAQNRLETTIDGKNGFYRGCLWSNRKSDLIIKKVQFENDIAEIALEKKDKRIDAFNIELKEKRAINTTLRLMLGLLLILFLTSLYYNCEQLKINRTLSTQNDSLTSENDFKEVILTKYRVWQTVKNDSSKKAINKFLKVEKINRINNFILPCPICGAKGYLHKAVNGMAWCVDCTMYDKPGHEHQRVGKKWHKSKQEAIYAWNHKQD
jgi:hypothetical protein